MASGKKKGKGDKEEEGEKGPFEGINTTIVLREARCFNDRQLNPHKCSYVLTQVLYLLSQGEQLTSEEATSLFFSVTKLFQSENIHLRRLVYLVIKSLTVDTDNSLIVVSCLNKDMTNKQDLFRANAIRVLAKIIDASMMGGIERFFKQAIVDKNPFVVISTLVAAQHLYKRTGGDIVKRWVGEIQTALNSQSRMVQYHALSMLHHIKRSDKLALQKVITGLISKPPASPLALCLQIRVVHSLLLDTRGQGNAAAALLQFITDCLRNRNPMVTYEAAKSLCTLPFASAAQVKPALTALQDFLSSPVPTQRFVAVRALSKLVMAHPVLVTAASADLEKLIADPNRNIGTLAITTLLKTGDESNVDRLMKSITGFMADISDEFKVVLVNAVKVLCVKFPHKHHTLLGFLAASLREEGGRAFKQALVDAMLEVIDKVKSAQETGLDHFCEFIEDCEFPSLAVKVLHVIGDTGPKTANPSRYIRFVYNRVILEVPQVRAAAVSCLCRFGEACPELRVHVCTLLRRCVRDDCDEVRDRAVMSLHLLEAHQGVAATLLSAQSPAPLADLEVSLQRYLERGDFDAGFDLGRDLREADTAAVVSAGGGVEAETAVSNDVVAADAEQQHWALLEGLPEYRALGTRLRSCDPVEVTEAETEYAVTCVKHVFPQHVLLQFNVRNNMADQLLENVSVELEMEADDWVEEFTIPEPSIRYEAIGVCFVGLKRPQDSFNSGAIACTLKFEYKTVEDGEVAAEEEGTPDEYAMEDLSVEEGDFMLGLGHSIGNLEFKGLWEAAAHEVMKKFSLQLDSLQAAVDAVIKMLGCTASENANQVPDGVSSHGVALAGTWLGADPPSTVLARTAFLLTPKGVTLKIAIRSKEQALSERLANAIG